MEKMISIVIPTYNRFDQLLLAIESVRKQTYPSIEIIVVDDASTQGDYASYPFDSHGVQLIRSAQNSRALFDFPCPGHTRNLGLRVCKGQYVAFLDDDDIWFPEKLSTQMKAMKDTGCKMSCTDGLFGLGVFRPESQYPRYNQERYWATLQDIYRSRGKFHMLQDGFPDIWNLAFLQVHNCVITSSVLLDMSLVKQTGEFKNVAIGREDHDYWLRALEHSDCVYVNGVHFYYCGRA